jgi:DNA repair photolyase
MDVPETGVIEAKTGVSRAGFPETFLPSLYRVTAPYRGCAHGCRYCDGRAERYYVEGEFDRDIVARTNLPDLVAHDVAEGVCSREYGAAGIGSGVTDVYQPIERELRLTRRTLEALIPARVPVVILTKNDLILRDFDLLARFPETLVIVTVTTVNEDRAAILEPGASSAAERIEVVRRAKEAGFLAGVMAMPLCPGISSSAESFAAVVDAATGAGADFVYPGGLTLRPGKQKDLFVSLVDDEFPDLAPLYGRMYRENRPSGTPTAAEYRPIEREWQSILRSRGVAQLIPHRVYRELLSVPDGIFVLLCHMETLYASRGVDVKPLRAATARYAEWLKGERTALRRKRIKPLEGDPFPITRILAEKLDALCAADIAHADIAHADSLANVIGNERLARTVIAIIRDRATFDYPSLSVRDIL